MKKTAILPQYLNLAEELRKRIECGEFGAGDILPSEAQLCAENGVSRGTAVRAIEQLVHDGIVHRRQGVGTFVARPSLHRRAGRLLSFSESAAKEGLHSGQSLMEFQPATLAQKREFDCKGEAVFLERLRYLNGLPCAIHRSLIPMRVANQIEELNGTQPQALRNEKFSLYQAFERTDFQVEEASERVTARLAFEEEIRVLHLENPATVMVVFRRSYDGKGRLIEAVEAIYDSNIYSYDLQLVRMANNSVHDNSRDFLSKGGQISKPNKGSN